MTPPTVTVIVQANHLGFSPGDRAVVDPHDPAVAAALAGGFFVEVTEPTGESLTGDGAPRLTTDELVSPLVREGVGFTPAQKGAITRMLNAGDLAGAQQLIRDELVEQLGAERADELLATDDDPED